MIYHMSMVAIAGLINETTSREEGNGHLYWDGAVTLSGRYLSRRFSAKIPYVAVYQKQNTSERVNRDELTVTGCHRSGDTKEAGGGKLTIADFQTPSLPAV